MTIFGVSEKEYERVRENNEKLWDKIRELTGEVARLRRILDGFQYDARLLCPKCAEMRSTKLEWEPSKPYECFWKCSCGYTIVVPTLDAPKEEK